MNVFHFYSILKLDFQFENLDCVLCFVLLLFAEKIRVFIKSDKETKDFHVFQSALSFQTLKYTTQGFTFCNLNLLSR